MAFKLNKEETAKLEELKKAVGAAHIEISSAVDTYNEEVTDLKEPVNKALETYNEKLEALREFVTSTADEKRADYDDKSDAWKEGDTGSTVEEWISTWENMDLEDVSLEFPQDELEVNFENHADVDLPTEP